MNHSEPHIKKAIQVVYDIEDTYPDGDQFQFIFGEYKRGGLSHKEASLIDRVAALSAGDTNRIHELAAMPNPNNADEIREALNHIYEITKP